MLCYIILRLLAEHFCIFAVQSHQLIVCTLFSHFPVADEIDAVSIPNGAEAVSDHDGRGIAQFRRHLSRGIVNI